VFTGLVEEVGTVSASQEESGGMRLRFRCREVLGGLERGDSVSVSGVCLTVERTDPAGGWFEVFAVEETRRRTTAGGWRRADRVNLERALRAGDRLGGHLVQGHVDGVGRIVRVRREGQARTLSVEIPSGLGPLVAEKGSLALDGVSLTVGRTRGRGCEVHLIPETLLRTTLGDLRGGERVNLEVDLLARYVQRLLQPGSSRPS